MNGPSLGLVMILKNEADNLPRSLAPVAGLFQEVVVVDTGSVDETPRLAEEMGARVISIAWKDDFSHARNRALQEAGTDWVLWLDGDNAISPEGVARLRNRIPEDTPAILWAQEEIVPSGERLWQKRCFPNRPEVRWRGRVHEQLVHPPDWPSIPTSVVIQHWGYTDPQKVEEKGRYYLRLLEQSLKETPRDFYIHFQMARCLINLREFQKAGDHLFKVTADLEARRINPEMWAHAHYLWAQTLERQGRPEEAMAVLDELVEDNPDHGLSHHHLGRLAYNRGLFDKAIFHLSKAITLGVTAPVVDLDPIRTSFLSHYYLGRALEKADRPEAAAKALTRAVDIQPQSVTAITDLARMRLALGEAEEARALLHKALIIRPEDRTARKMLDQMEAGE